MIEFKDLIVHADKRGYLSELLRNDDRIFSGEFGQVLLSVVRKDIIKAFHLHKYQTDYTTCIKGKIMYAWADEERVFNVAILTGDNPKLIKTPPGIWHGYQAIDDDAILIHVMDKVYNPDDVFSRDKNYYGDLWHKI